MKHPLETLHADDLERVTTEDGSPTLRHRTRGITYRSRFGAQRESEDVFLGPSGMAHASAARPWRVVELGFGAATNFCTTAQRAMQHGLSLHYLSFDHAPIPASMLGGDDPITRLAQRALAIARREGHATLTHQRITLTLRASEWLALSPADEPSHAGCDALYYDPFGPEDDPESWSAQHLRHAAGWLGECGCLMTYSVAGRVRRGLLDAGLHVATLPGHVKREVLLASPSQQVIQARQTLRTWEPVLNARL